jgi:hypothetical protein
MCMELDTTWAQLRPQPVFVRQLTGLCTIWLTLDFQDDSLGMMADYVDGDDTGRLKGNMPGAYHYELASEEDEDDHAVLLRCTCWECSASFAKRV